MSDRTITGANLDAMHRCARAFVELLLEGHDISHLTNKLESMTNDAWTAEQVEAFNGQLEGADEKQHKSEG